MTNKTPQNTLKFEQAMAELEGVVTSLEKGDMPLDDALQAFEKGTKLIKQCQNQLKNAELRVEQVLTDEAGEAAGSTHMENKTTED